MLQLLGDELVRDDSMGMSEEAFRLTPADDHKAQAAPRGKTLSSR